MADDDPVARAHRMIVALRHAQDRLAALVAALPPDALTAPSYDDGWTVADVLSHIGSGAEIFGAIVEAGLAGHEAPGPDSFPAVWERWNAKPPEVRAADAVSVNEAFVARLEHLSDARLAAIDMQVFGMPVDGTMVARMRLSEHALHTWDVAVALDPEARIDAEAVALLLDNLPALASRIGRSGARPQRVHVRTTHPDGDWFLETGATIELVPWAGQAGDGTLALPAEALLRLVYGRLDADHTPTSEITIDGAVDLPALRDSFPGF
jgi:uncharacterized protein (TIGR03083 family)